MALTNKEKIHVLVIDDEGSIIEFIKRGGDCWGLDVNIIERIRLKKKIVRAVIYVRFSSDNQREESIDAQINRECVKMH